MLRKMIKLPLTIRFTVLSFFILATSIVALMAIGFQYHFSKQAAIENSADAFENSAVETRKIVSSKEKTATQTAVYLSRFLEFDQDDPAVQRRNFERFKSFLEANPMFLSVYFGTNDGFFYEIINLDALKAAREIMGALPADKWARLTISLNEHQQRILRTDFMDSDGNIRFTDESPTDLIPSERPWYKKIHRGEVYKTIPYLLQTTQVPGLSYSRSISGKNAVVGIDIALESLSESLLNQEASQYGEIYIYDGDGRIIASNQMIASDEEITDIPMLELNEEQRAYVDNLSVLKVSNELDWAPFDFTVYGQPYGYAIDVLNVISKMTGIEFEYINGYSWKQLLDRFERGQIDILQPVTGAFEQKEAVLVSDAFIEAPYGVVTKQNAYAIQNVEQLKGMRVAIPEGWSIINTINRLYPEIIVVEFPDIKSVLDAVRNGQVDAGLDNSLSLSYNLEEFFFDDLEVHQPVDFSPNEVDEGLYLVVNKELSPLMNILNLAIAEMPKQIKSQLKTKWEEGGIDGSDHLTTIRYPSLLGSDLKLNELHYQELNGVDNLVYVTSIDGSKNQLYAAISPLPELLAPAMEKVKTSIFYTILGLMLLAPMCWFFANPIIKPILQLAENARKLGQRDFDKVVDVDSNVVEILELKNSMTNMASDIKHYEESQEALLDSFIELIAQAIDDKSPYTAGHCERVPQLALMMADYAHNDSSEAFRSFTFKSDEERREFRIAAWLHDCGKVITPEHIVDKGSKLETIYNRIHEIRARFEILWRDAEIRYLTGLMDAPENNHALMTQLKSEQERLVEEFEFVAKSNIGGEFMKDEDVARLHEIGQQSWTRHFDNKLGLSPVEEMRLQNTSSDLPATEQLLADKPEHIIPRNGNSKTYDPSFGIKMEVPEHLYNLGEIYNLSISRGTLTAEDRFKINEHIISTIKMLEKLPLPDELSRVPRYASTHHETLKGTGYPRKLVAEDLSLLERIMVLSDIYEALTAADRPYKKAKPISVAIDILYKMVQDDHVDADVFELFLKSGIYLEYARKFLSEDQIDEVNVYKYLKA